MPNSLVIKKYDPQWPILFEELQVVIVESEYGTIEEITLTYVGVLSKPRR
jgi:hypothetical protein